MSQQELLALQETLYTSQNPTRRWLHCSRRDWILPRLKQYGNGARRALEVGPGSGLYLPILVTLADEVVAADIEKIFLEHAAQLAALHPTLSCVIDNITSTRLDKAGFDLVLCTEVIEHIADSPAALAGLASLLAPEGRLVLTTPQRYSPLELCGRLAFLPGIINIVRLIYREPVLDMGHINLLTEKQLREQFDTAGLTVLESEKLGLYLPLIAEFLGRPGQRILAALDNWLRDSPLSGLLWTQCYVLAVRETPA